MGPEVLSALSLPHAHPQLRKLKSNLVHPLPKMSALPPMLSAKKSPTRRDAKRSSTTTAPTLEDMLMLTHNIWVMVDSTTDSDMPDMPTPPSLPSPSPPPSPRPLRLPALRSPPNIALMSQLSRRSSPPSRLATLSPRVSAHPPSTPSPRSLVKPELPKSSNTPSSPTMELTLTAVKHLKPKSFKTAI